MKIPTIAQLVTVLQAHGWVVHREPYRLNIVVLRRTPGTLDAFDDMIVVFHYAADGRGYMHAARCTADPGKPSREHPRRADGTAVWAVGQVVDALALGLHRGDYACYVPVRPIPVLRFTSVADSKGEPSTSSSTQIHRASATHESTVVGAWSEGCVVYASPTDYDASIALARRAARAGWPLFTVSCLEWQGR